MFAADAKSEGRCESACINGRCAESFLNSLLVRQNFTIARKSGNIALGIRVKAFSLNTLQSIA